MKPTNDWASDVELEQAMSEWRGVLGPERVLSHPEAQGRHGAATDNIRRRIAGAVRPRTTAEVQAVVRVADRHAIALYPVSTGRNWGYGSANPTSDDAVVVDLSEMNRILHFDAELGLVTVQPGVTQADLRAFLDEHELPFMVPTTGAGPTCSLMGNALERGYGITPHADHFGAVTSLRAVLPSGHLYQSAHAEQGAKEVDHGFKWGIGPYLDGLFAQSNLGIVTEMTLCLARLPERVEGFYFWVEREEDLERAVTAVRDILRTFTGIASSINLMNRRRLLSMTVPYPHARAAKGGTLPQAVVDEIAGANNLPMWMGMGTLYGERHVVKAARKAIKRVLRRVARRCVFVTPRMVRWAKRLRRWLPGSLRQRLSGLIDSVDASLQLMTGRPHEVAMPLCYWKQHRTPLAGAPIDPARDRTGLLWYAPLVPLKPERVRCYVNMVERICTEHGIEPLITLTSLSERMIDSTVPVLFDRDDELAVARAHACFDALLEAGRREGFVPYRIGVRHRDRIIDMRHGFWRLAAQLKDAVDPNGILAPGRYAPTAAEQAAHAAAAKPLFSAIEVPRVAV